jgi:hypothetical protein
MLSNGRLAHKFAGRQCQWGEECVLQNEPKHAALNDVSPFLSSDSYAYSYFCSIAVPLRKRSSHEESATARR